MLPNRLAVCLACEDGTRETVVGDYKDSVRTLLVRALSREAPGLVANAPPFNDPELAVVTAPQHFTCTNKDSYAGLPSYAVAEASGLRAGRYRGERWAQVPIEREGL